jgi:hypothetical protein
MKVQSANHNTQKKNEHESKLRDKFVQKVHNIVHPLEASLLTVIIEENMSTSQIYFTTQADNSSLN